MRMRNMIREWLRQRAADKVVRIGEQLRAANIELARGSVDDPDYRYLEMYRDRLEQERERLLTYLKETA